MLSQSISVSFAWNNEFFLAVADDTLGEEAHAVAVDALEEAHDVADAALEEAHAVAVDATTIVGVAAIVDVAAIVEVAVIDEVVDETAARDTAVADFPL